MSSIFVILNLKVFYVIKNTFSETEDIAYKNIVHKQKTSYPLFIYQPRGQGLGKDTLGTRAVR